MERRFWFIFETVGKKVSPNLKRILGWKLPREKLTLVIFLTSLFLVSQLYLSIFADLEEARKPELDLAGTWELCLPEQSSIEGCQWRPVSVPHELVPALRPQLHGWLIYRKRFVAPAECLGPNSACTLFFGEIGDAAEAKLNGVAIGRRGDFPPREVYFKHYPVRFDLSRNLLKPGENEITLTIFSMKRVQAGVCEGPVGIYTATDGFKTAQSSIAYTIFAPLLGFVGLFIIGIITTLMTFIQKTEDSKIHAYIHYCFASSLFLLSLSEIPREFLPIGLAGYLHSILRIIADLAYFELVREFFNFRTWVKNWIRPLYLLALLVFLINFIQDFSSGNLGNGGSGFDLAHVVLRIALPLILLPHCMGIFGAIREKKGQTRSFFVVIFLLLLLLQIHDCSIFHGVTTGTYAVRIYPLFIGIIFGFSFLEKTREERTKTILEQEQAKQMKLIHTELRDIAHELKEPLAGLSMGCDRIRRRPSDPGPLQDAAKSFPEEIASLQRRISSLLQYSGEMSNAPNLKLHSVDLVQFIREVADRVKDSSGREDLKIKVQGEKEQISAAIDQDKMASVFTNLFRNPIAAYNGHPDPEINVSVKAPNLTRPWIEVSVVDYGRGIPEEIKNRLFEPFATFGKKDGTGLGLALSKRIIEAHGGSVSLDLTQESGAAFRVIIPRI